MIKILLIAAGGGAGSTMRYLLSGLAQRFQTVESGRHGRIRGGFGGVGQRAVTLGREDEALALPGAPDPGLGCPRGRRAVEGAVDFHHVHEAADVGQPV